MKSIRSWSTVVVMSFFYTCYGGNSDKNIKAPVDYLNPYMGNIRHLLVPTFPTIHLPNSMLRVYPERSDYTSDLLHGLPLVVTSHIGSSAFNLSLYQGDKLEHVIDYSYDNEEIRPYYYKVTLDDSQNINVKYDPSFQSALYDIEFVAQSKSPYIIINSRNGKMRVHGNIVSGYQQLDNNNSFFIYLESKDMPTEVGVIENSALNKLRTETEGNNACVALKFDSKNSSVVLKYGISFISEEQAKKNMLRELKDYNLETLKNKGRYIWNKALFCIDVDSDNSDYKKVLYTSLYSIFERPVCISEDERYFSAFDGKIHDDNGILFYTDDWIWDTYRAAHPLRLIIDEKPLKDIINSYLLMAEQMGNMWMPTFPEITGDSCRMNSNHAVATVADAAVKGLDIDLEKAYEACRKAIEEKTLAPWSRNAAGWIDDFYKRNGYIPGLKSNEQETDPNVHPFERRQPIAVTLGTSYDQWCLSVIADKLGKNEDVKYYLKCSYNYRNVYNHNTGFFHPKNKDGNWITPFDYRFSGGQGARDYYGENNGWIYRWYVPHNVADLIDLMGGLEMFILNLDKTFREPLGKSKSEFYYKLPDVQVMLDSSLWPMNLVCIYFIIMQGNLGKLKKESVSCLKHGFVMI